MSFPQKQLWNDQAEFDLMHPMNRSAVYWNVCMCWEAMEIGGEVKTIEII